MGQRDHTIRVLSGDLCHFVIYKTGSLDINPIEPAADMENGLIHPGPIHRLDLLPHIGCHERRRKQLHATASNAKPIALPHPILIRASKRLRVSIMLIRHPVVMGIDHEVLFTHAAL